MNHINNDLLVKYLLEEADETERGQVEHWIQVSPKNEQHFNDFKLIWEESARIAQKTTINIEDAWQRFQQRRLSAPSSGKVVPLKNLWQHWQKIAAAILIVVTTTITYYTINKTDKRIAEQITVTTNAVSQTNTLPDGSVATLNKKSALTYPKNLEGRTRTVQLKGEAFFNVAADKQKPFIVNVSNVIITVVGTSFNVKNTNSAIEVIVESGIVQVRKNNQTIQLVKGEKVLIKQNDSILTKQITTDQLYNYYRSKQFVCEDTPLWKLVNTLNEAYETNIVIAKPELGNLTITTSFNNETLDTILNIVAETLNLTLEKTAGKIILK